MGFCVISVRSPVIDTGSSEVLCDGSVLYLMCCVIAAFRRAYRDVLPLAPRSALSGHGDVFFAHVSDSGARQKKLRTLRFRLAAKTALSSIPSSSSPATRFAGLAWEVSPQSGDTNCFIGHKHYRTRTRIRTR